jgi:hypothetical protein
MYSTSASACREDEHPVEHAALGHANVHGREIEAWPRPSDLSANGLPSVAARCLTIGEGMPGIGWLHFGVSTYNCIAYGKTIIRYNPDVRAAITSRTAAVVPVSASDDQRVDSLSLDSDAPESIKMSQEDTQRRSLLPLALVGDGIRLAGLVRASN